MQRVTKEPGFPGERRHQVLVVPPGQDLQQDLGHPHLVDACFGDQLHGHFEHAVAAAPAVLGAGCPAALWCGCGRLDILNAYRANGADIGGR